MYAIIVSGGKQHRITKGEILRVEKLEAQVGAPVEFMQVLMVKNEDQAQFGNPYVKNAKVLGEVVAQGRDKKINIIKFRRRKHYMKKQGHKQYYTAVKINDIVIQ